LIGQCKLEGIYFAFFSHPQKTIETPTHTAHIAKAPQDNAATEALTKSAILPTHTVLI